MAGGANAYSIYAPIRVCTENTAFSMPESLIGYVADGGASYFFSRVPKYKELGLYLGVTGQQIKGD